MLEVGQSHPYNAITKHLLEWIGCLVRRDFEAAEYFIDDFEGNSRIHDYFTFDDDDGPVQAIDPADSDDWWQISFNPTSDGSLLVEVYIPLADEYRPMNACFIFTPVPNGFRVTFQYCKPS